jgi:hypothetical protein
VNPSHVLNKMRSTIVLLAAICLTLPNVPSAATAGGRASYISYEDAAPILEALREALPPDLRVAAKSEFPAAWRNWVQRRDQEIRARLVQGDEDSIVNFLLFGTSFTRKPRITLSSLAQFGDKLTKSVNTSPEVTSFLDSIKARADDLIQAMTSPSANERVLFAQRVVESKGFDPRTLTGRPRVKEYLLTSLVRVLNEQSGYARILQSAQLLGDPSAEFAERSKLFSNRGLSSDTSLLPNFAIERALSSMKAQGMLAAGSVRRIGIIGPGLDFTDKQDGYDFYPQQTLQPFAIIDTLLRLSLARASTLKVTTLDLSPRINDHIRRARARGQSGRGYVVQLPRDAQGQWKHEAVNYWATFGDRIGVPVTPVSVPAGAGDVKVRAVRIRPAIVSTITPEDLNIVVQRLETAAAERFDLIIATNILVYYDVFEQSLALANIEHMLRPGGFLLSNNALLELPSSHMHSVGYETVAYSDKPSDGDHIVWYQRSADK